MKKLILLFLLFVNLGLFAQNEDPKFKVALVLPFKSNAYGNHGKNGEAMFEYYAGFKLALRDLEMDGLRLQLFVFDSNKDSTAMERIISHPDMKNMDLIIGPVFSKEVYLMDSFCSAHRITYVNPLKYYSPLFKDYKAINFFGNDTIITAGMVQKAMMYFPKHSYYLLDDNSAKSISLSTVAKSEIKKSNPSKKIIEGQFINKTLTNKPAANDSVIIICNGFSNEYKKAVFDLCKTHKNAVIIANSQWLKNVSAVPKNVIFALENKNATGDTNYIAFSRMFKARQSSEASKFAYQGYDQAMYLCYGLMAFGKNFIYSLPQADYVGFIQCIKLEKNGNEVNNYGLHFMHYNGGKLKEFEP